MKKSIIPCVLIFVALLGTACEKVIEFDGEITEPRLTLSAKALTGEPFRVYVASSVFFLNTRGDRRAYTETLDTLRGEIRCFVNDDRTGKRMVLQPEDEGYASYCYLAEDYVPAPGDHIRLEAEFPGFDPVWVETDVPLLPRLEIVSMGEWTLMEQNGGWGDLDYYQVEMTLRVTDDGSYDKYYCLQPFAVYSFEPAEMDLEEGLRFRSTDIIFQQMDASALEDLFDFETETELTGGYFSDRFFKGKSYTFKILLIRVPAPETLKKLGLRISTVNESLYWFDLSYSKLQNEVSFFSEGVTLYSNVHGGYGILGAAASSWLEVER